MPPLKQLAVLVVLGGAVAALWHTDPAGLIRGPERTATAGAAAPAALAAVPVIVAPVDFASDAAVVEAVGSGVAVQAVTLYPEAAGRVAAMSFAAGERVAAGEPLMHLDAEEERLAVDLARVHLEDARQRLARYEKAPRGALSADEIATARTTLEAARIELAQAELALSQRTLTAPFAGVIGIPLVDVGDRVTETSAIASLDDRSTLLIDFDVPEAFAYGVREGGSVTATTWAIPGASFPGTIAAIGSRIDPTTRTLRVRAEISDEQDRLRTGMSFIVRLPLPGDRFPAVPSVAIQWGREGAHVWGVRDGTARRIPVRVLKRSEQQVLVEAPLKPGDAIVVEGLQRLRPGVPVEVRAADDAAAAAADDRDT